MITKGETLRFDSGRRVRLADRIGNGGQGEVYESTDVKTGQRGAVKVFYKRFANRDTVKRIRFLMDQNFHATCPVLRPPIDVFRRRDMVGHYTPFVEGETLERFLDSPSSSFLEQLELAITFAHAVNVMHARGIAHGDIQLGNFMVARAGPALRLHAIDLDNFCAPGLPVPDCVGHLMYMAPELREGLAKGWPAVPSLSTDLFALGVLMHDIILLRHVSVGNDDSEASFLNAMCSGRWVQDPAVVGRSFSSVGGYPAEVLNPGLARLFRSALGLDPAQRPSARSWEIELGRAVDWAYVCPSCGGVCVVDVSKTVCPYPACRRPFPFLTLRVNGHGRPIPLKDGATVLGRAELGGSMRVSGRHAVFRRLGPKTWVESLGRNGTFVWMAAGWSRIPEAEPKLVTKGDRLRFADVEAVVE